MTGKFTDRRKDSDDVPYIHRSFNSSILLNIKYTELDLTRNDRKIFVSLDVSTV